MTTEHQRTADRIMHTAPVPRPLDAAIRSNTTATATAPKRCSAHGTGGTWHAVHVAPATAVFAPYHQRPKDSVT